MKTISLRSINFLCFLSLCFLTISSCSLFDTGKSRNRSTNLLSGEEQLECSSGQQSIIEGVTQCIPECDAGEHAITFNGSLICVSDSVEECDEDQTLTFINDGYACIDNYGTEEEDTNCTENPCNASTQYCKDASCHDKKDLGVSCDGIVECKSNAQYCAVKNGTAITTCLGKHGVACTASSQCYNIPNKSAICKVNPTITPAPSTKVCWQAGNGTLNSKCNYANECNTPLSCVNGICIQQAGGGECTNDAGCDGKTVSGQVCQSGKCFCKSSACYHKMNAGASPCDANTQCLSGLCLNTTSPRQCGCNVWDECGGSQTCSPTTHICGSTCTYGIVPGQLGSCSSGYYCNNGLACVERCTAPGGSNPCANQNTSDFCELFTGMCISKLGYNSPCGGDGQASCSNACKSGVKQSSASKCGCTTNTHCTEGSSNYNYCDTTTKTCKTLVPLGSTCNSSSDCQFYNGTQSVCRHDLLRDPTGDTKYCGYPLGYYSTSLTNNQCSSETIAPSGNYKYCIAGAGDPCTMAGSRLLGLYMDDVIPPDTAYSACPGGQAATVPCVSGKTCTFVRKEEILDLNRCSLGFVLPFDFTHSNLYTCQ